MKCIVRGKASEKNWYELIANLTSLTWSYSPSFTSYYPCYLLFLGHNNPFLMPPFFILFRSFWLQEENVERFLSQEPKGVPFRFEDVSAIHISSDPTTRDQQEVKDRYSEAIGCLLVTRIAKLLAIRFEKLLSYSHSDEYPELVRTVKEWLKILDIRADIEIQSNQRCSLETINSFSLCIGMLAHMFFGVDRALTDQLPMSLHFRSRSGREIARSFAEQGMFTVPPYLLLALFEPRRIKQGNLTFGLLEEDNETTFLLRDYMFALALGKRSIDGRSKFNFWCHMTAEIMKFSPPSVLSLLLLHYIAASICETLVRHHNFHMKVRVKTRNRAKTVWQVSNHEIYEMYHVDATNTDGQGRPEVTKLNTKPRFGGIDADKYGALFIFDPENFRTIIRCLKHASASGIGGVRPQFKEDQQEIHRDCEVLRTLLKTVVTRAFNTEGQYNRTLLVAFFKTLFEHMRLYAPPHTRVTEGGLRQPGSWEYEFLENIWLSAMFKARMTYLPGFSQTEERTAKIKFTRVHYKEEGRQGVKASQNIAVYDKAFYQNYATETLGLDLSTSCVKMERLRDALVIYAAQLLDIHLSYHWSQLENKIESLSIEIEGRNQIGARNEEDDEEQFLEENSDAEELEAALDLLRQPNQQEGLGNWQTHPRRITRTIARHIDQSNDGPQEANRNAQRVTLQDNDSSQRQNENQRMTGPRDVIVESGTNESSSSSSSTSDAETEDDHCLSPEEAIRKLQAIKRRRTER